MTMFLEATRPVLFETEGGDYCYWGLGSSLFVATSHAYYWVTARHVIEKQNGSIDELRIFPTDASRMSIPFNSFIDITPEEQDPGFADLIILRVDQEMFQASGDAPLTAQDVELGLASPDELAKKTKLIVVGFPEQGRSVDYEDFKIKYRRSVLATIPRFQ